MTRLPRLFLLLSSLLLGAAALPAEPAASGDLVTDGKGNPWSGLFERLAAKGNVRSSFVEERWFSVRKQPVILRGELRHSAEFGLSLHYREPAEQVLVIDRAGLLMRDHRGRDRTLAADPRAPRIDALLLPVLRFDLKEISRYFVVRAEKEGAEWRIKFVPRSAELERQLSTLSVYGAGDEVQRLEFRRASNQSVVVRIETTETGVVFSPEEIKRFFR